MDEATSQEGLVLVPVPVQYLRAVYKLLAEMMDAPSDEPDEEGIVVDDVQGRWTRSMVVTLHGRLHLDGVRAMLDALAKFAPEEAAMLAGAELAGVTPHQLRAQMGALSKLTKKLFKKTTWPMSVRYNEAGQAFYSMPVGIAAWWIEAGG
jgi:hypothetical protein